MRKLKLLEYFLMGSLQLLTLGGIEQAGAADPRTAPLQQRVVIPPQISNVTLNPSSVTGGVTPVIGTVTLNQTAPPGGVLVTFNNSNPSVAAVPPSVVVQSGASSATFVIQTYPVAQNPNVVTAPPFADISAQMGSSAPRSAKLTVVPATLTSVTLNPTSVPGGTQVTGQVAISGPAPAGGLTIGLSSSAATSSPPPRPDLSAIRETAPTTVAQQVTIAPGATTAVFTITTRPVSTSTPVTISATYGAFNTKTATLTILPLGVASISFPNNTAGPYNNAFVEGGQTASGSVVLTSAAPAGGVDVKLTISPYTANQPNPCTPKPSAPGVVHVKQGETTAAFQLTSFPAGGNPNWFTITAAYGSSAVTANVHVNQANVASLTLPQSVKGGTTVQLGITLTGPMGQCPSNVFSSSLGRIMILNSNTVVAQASSHVQVPGGATSATVTITTSAVAQTTAVTIGAYHIREEFKKVATLTLTP